MSIIEKLVPSRVTLLHDTEDRWDTKPEFIPKQSEMIIYDEDNTHSYKRIKIGDGVTPLKDIKFATISKTELDVILAGIQTQITQNEIQISETQPDFACMWFHVTGEAK